MRWLNLALGATLTLAEFFIHGAAEVCGGWDEECEEPTIFRLADSTDCGGTCDSSTCCEEAGSDSKRSSHALVENHGRSLLSGVTPVVYETCGDWEEDCPGDHVTLADSTQCMLYFGTPIPCDSSTCCEEAEICEDWDGECPDDHVTLPDDTFCWGLCDESTCCEEADDDDSGGDDMWGDPHMRGLRGQRIDWYGVDGGWYSLIKDDNADLNVNIRVTAPLPDEFPNRQLMTGLTVLSEGHSLVIEVANPYTINTDGCPRGVSPCLANGGLRIYVDGQEADELLRFSRHVPVGDGAITVSATNLPVECRQFGGDKIWAHTYKDMIDGRRRMLGDESLEEWILRYDHSMPARRWCAKYIAENDLADLQSTHAIFKIETPSVTVRLNAGVNYQGEGALDWDGRVLPDLEFWQMDVGIDGLDVENPALSGLLGETSRPTYDKNEKEVMAGFKAFRGTVEDYRVSSALGVHFPLLDKNEKEILSGVQGGRRVYV
ncbi:unnamed protein product [Ectocarpus sp. 12 AP-2014]